MKKEEGRRKKEEGRRKKKKFCVIKKFKIKFIVTEKLGLKPRP
ncbi:hypothetical protein [Okeania sp. SIO3B5]|nr:hypothetical protein [Okeania sp. SIO3B5]